MTRSFLALAFAAPFLPLLAGAQSAGNLTVDEIIAKNIQARGGLEKLKAVKTIRGPPRSLGRLSRHGGPGKSAA